MWRLGGYVRCQTLALNTTECVRLVHFALIGAMSSPRRAINGSRSTTYRLVQISGATSESYAQSLEEPGRLSGLTDLAECVHIRLVIPYVAHRIEIMPGRKVA